MHAVAYRNKQNDKSRQYSCGVPTVLCSSHSLRHLKLRHNVKGVSVRVEKCSVSKPKTGLEIT